MISTIALRPASFASMSLAARYTASYRTVPRAWLIVGTGPELIPENPAFSFRSIEPVLQIAWRPGDVLQQFRVGSEADQECHVLLPENARKERGSGAAFDFDQIALAAGDIDEEPDRQGQIRLAREIFDGLGSTVFGQREVAFLEGGDQRVLLVPHRAIEVDDIDIDLDWLAGVVFHFLLGVQMEQK